MELSLSTLNTQLQHGVVKGEGMHSLLHLMQGVYGPQLVANKTWPDSTRKEIAGQYHKFMASLTETANQVILLLLLLVLLLLLLHSHLFVS